MKLYYAPGTSAVGIRVLLEEIGKPYEVALLDLAAREQYQPAFSSINPKSKVPTLIRDDGSVLTEFGAIARWLARTHPEAALLPQDPDSEARAIELLDYVVGTVHMRGFSRMIVPMAFGPEAHHAEVVATGRGMAAKGFEVIDAGLAGKAYVVGRYSYAELGAVLRGAMGGAILDTLTAELRTALHDDDGASCGQARACRRLLR